MKLLILFTAIGVIGVMGTIGTVEYAQAQTPLNIPPPANIPDSEHATFEILSDGESKYYLGASNQTIHSNVNPQGNFYFPSDTYLQSNPVFPTTREFTLCSGGVFNVKDIDNTYVPNFSIPDNINPTTKSEVVAIGINIYVNETQFAGDSDEYTVPCQTDLEATSLKPIFTEKDLRVTITGKHDKKPYYFSPRENVTQAQPILACSDDNFDTTTQTLKGITKMCYGKNGNDMVIITKRFLGFYGATDSITPPKDPKDLDGTITQSKAYVELLKRLYLPPI